MSPEQATSLHALLERAIYDLQHGWPEAAYDVLVRARDLLAAHP